MKTIIVDGRIGKDAEVLTTKNGVQYLRFSLANDQFSNGENKTEWFDVTTFDSFIINKKAEYLTKGRYVIVTGTPNATVNISGGKVYQNLGINAYSVELPSVGPRKQEGQAAGTVTEGVSTYSNTDNRQPSQKAGFQPAPQAQFQPKAAQPAPQAQFKPQPAPQPQFQPQAAQPAPQFQPTPQPQFQPQVAQAQFQPQQFAPQQATVGFQPQGPAQMPLDLGADDGEDLPF